MSHSYPSNISREQFARDSADAGVGPAPDQAPHRGPVRRFLRGVYLLKSGCQWRMLPADFPDWRTCYKYFRQWSERPGPDEDSILEQVLKKIGWRGPAKHGRKSGPASVSWTPRA